MKLMFASDIHGSYYYAQKTVEAYREEKAEKLSLLVVDNWRQKKSFFSKAKEYMDKEDLDKLRLLFDSELLPALKEMIETISNIELNNEVNNGDENIGNRWKDIK